MDAQAIGTLVSVVSAAIAALALLLTWYRHERRTAQRPTPRPRKKKWIERSLTRERVAALSILLIVGSAGFGIYKTSTATPQGPSQSNASKMSATQYRSQVAQICADSAEEARRIEESSPQATVMGANIDIERRQVGRIKALAPPADLKAMHDDLIATWEQRIALLDSVYRRLGRPDEKFDVNLDAANKMAEKVTNLFQSLEVPSCGF